jgi:integrase
MIDVSTDTILRRAVPWQPEPVRHRIRYKLLVLDTGTRQERRYFASDVESLLSANPVPSRFEIENSDATPVLPLNEQSSRPKPQHIESPPAPNHIVVPEAETASNLKSKGSRLKGVESGIYQDVITHTYYERPFVNGKRTCRSLKTKNLKFAREELHRRRAVALSGKSPYEAVNGSVLSAVTVGEVIRTYQQAEYPDKRLNSRPESTRKDEERNCEVLLEFWNAVPVNSASIAVCDRYRDWRLGRIKRGKGLRTTDCELNTLNNAFRYALRRELVQKNPLLGRSKYQSSKMVVHCRQFMPGNAEELHEAARQLFGVAASEVLGFQLLLTAYTGQRTCEILRLRLDAGPDEPGRVTEDGKCLRVWRAKGQDMVNPFCRVHEGLEALLNAHRIWLKERHPNSPGFLPGRIENELVDKGALAHALRRLWERGLIKRKITPHGARAYYVTVRRSQGATDSQIALEIGHTSGGNTLSTVYGGVPPDWLHGGGPKMSWLPSGAPAWSDLLIGLQKVPKEPIPEAGQI